MTIALPAAAYGGPHPGSILELEPLLAFTRDCRPDAVCLLPPPGPDDQPNGPALLAMKDRLTRESLQVLGGWWEVPADAPVSDPGWQIEHLFAARALAAVLGEAGIGPLLLHWKPDAGATGSALREFLPRLLEEAERASVPIALRAGGAWEELLPLLVELESSCLGVCLDLADRFSLAGAALAALPGRVLAVSAGEAALPRAGSRWPVLLEGLRRAGYSGPVVLEGLRSPLEYAQAVGFFRGLTARTS